jgi:hypothetical protein
MVISDMNLMTSLAPLSVKDCSLRTSDKLYDSKSENDFLSLYEFGWFEYILVVLYYVNFFCIAAREGFAR